MKINERERRMEWNYENICNLWDCREEENIEIRRNTRLVVLLDFILGIIIGLIWINNKISTTSLSTMILIITCITFFLIHAIIHETGHLIGGLVSDYRLISFRIFSLVLVKNDESYKFKILKLNGTYGQCLMLPPKGIEFTQCPYYLYNIGGIFFDMLISILVCISALWLCENPIIKNFLLIFVVLGVYLSIINYVPIPMATNDGSNIRAIRKNKVLLQPFMQQLFIPQALFDGKDIHEFTQQEIELPKDSDITEPINSFFLNIQYMKYLKVRDFTSAESILLQLESEYYSMPKRMRLFIDVERLFLLLIQEADLKGIKTHYLYIKKAMKKNKSYPSVLRTLYAYEKMIHKDDKKSIQILKRIQMMLHTNPIPQEVRLNIELIHWMDEQIISVS